MNGLINNVKAIVEEVFECPGQLETKNRKKPIPDARKAYSKLLGTYFPMLTGDIIGESINRKYCTIYNQRGQHDDLYETNNRVYIKLYEACEEKVRGLTEHRPVDFKELLRLRIKDMSQNQSRDTLEMIKKRWQKD